MRFLLMRLLSCLLIVLCVSSCGRKQMRTITVPEYAPARDEFSIMTYNLHQYAFDDRDGDGQEDDPKPLGERRAVISIIVAEKPDVLAVQEIGSPEVFKEFQAGLENAGLIYKHVEYLRRGKHENNMAVLSRFPIINRQSHTNDTYSIGAAKVAVARGFVDVDIRVNDAYVFRLIVAHLKSKVFNKLGQTEMRRNEARLLSKHIRKALKSAPQLNLLVVGDMNDTYKSAALREVRGKTKKYLFDLRPRDVVGDTWTRVSITDDQYDRIDYLLVSAGMSSEVVVEKTHVVRHPEMFLASDHRPLVAVFHSREVSAE
jgi:endonuclease/exonuclease/phosphatase family metal-dependent hydrolase